MWWHPPQRKTFGKNWFGNKILEFFSGVCVWFWQIYVKKKRDRSPPMPHMWASISVCHIQHTVLVFHHPHKYKKVYTIKSDTSLISPPGPIIVVGQWKPSISFTGPLGGEWALYAGQFYMPKLSFTLFDCYT
jgi:hypothetical protein